MFLGMDGSFKVSLSNGLTFCLSTDNNDNIITEFGECKDEFYNEDLSASQYEVYENVYEFLSEHINNLCDKEEFINVMCDLEDNL